MTVMACSSLGTVNLSQKREVSMMTGKEWLYKPVIATVNDDIHDMGRWVAKWLGKINVNTRFYNYR